MSALDFYGFVDNTFQSLTPATRTSRSGGAYDTNGIWVEGTPTETTHKVNIQPVSNRETSFLNLGADRVHDVRKVYVTDGDLYNISEADTWVFESGQGVDGTYETISVDNRVGFNYCKVIVSRKDD